jgi:hypothetical protein
VAGISDRDFGLESRRIFELVDHMSVPGQRKPSVMTELTGNVDDASAFVQ